MLIRTRRSHLANDQGPTAPGRFSARG